MKLHLLLIILIYNLHSADNQHVAFKLYNDLLFYFLGDPAEPAGLSVFTAIVHCVDPLTPIPIALNSL